MILKVALCGWPMPRMAVPPCAFDAQGESILDKIVESAQGERIFSVTGNQLRKAFEHSRNRAAERGVQDGKSRLALITDIRWHDMLKKQSPGALMHPGRLRELWISSGLDATA